MGTKKNEQKKEQESTELVPIEDMVLEDIQMAEQLYNSAGLDPVVNAGLKDYDEKIKQENKLLNKVLGPRESDIRGYGEAVARRVAFAVYALMNRQYGGKVGDLRQYINTLEDERDRANNRYDELMGRVVGILGQEYRELRSDSNKFMEKLTDIMGDDIKETKIDQKALAESLADIDGLRNKIIELSRDTERQKEKYEIRLTSLTNENQNLQTQRKDLETRLEAQRESHEARHEKLQEKHETTLEKVNEKHDREVAEFKRQIGGLESEIKELETVKEKQSERIKELESIRDRHTEQIKELESIRDKQAEQITKLESVRESQAATIQEQKADYARLKKAAETLNEAVSLDELGEKLGRELYDFILHDSKVPDMVIEGVGKFFDFQKYFSAAAVKGAEATLKSAGERLDKALQKPEV